MSIHYPAKKHPNFKLPRLENPRFQTGGLSAVAIGHGCQQLDLVNSMKVLSYPASNKWQLPSLHAKQASVNFQSKARDEDQAHLLGVTFFYSFHAKSVKG